MKPVAFAMAVILLLLGAGCCLIPKIYSNPVEAGKYNMQVFKEFGKDPYAQWEKEGRKLCGGDFTTIERHYFTEPSGTAKDKLIGSIQCLDKPRRTGSET
jgi:hypothetical protein